jgi:hypothetical protein
VSSPAVPRQRLLTVEIIQLHQLKSSLHRPPYGTHRVENTVSNGTSIVSCLSVSAGTCLPSRCLETNVVSEPFASNGCFSGSTVLALNKYATIYSAEKGVNDVR